MVAAVSGAFSYFQLVDFAKLRLNTVTRATPAMFSFLVNERTQTPQSQLLLTLGAPGLEPGLAGAVSAGPPISIRHPCQLNVWACRHVNECKQNITIILHCPQAGGVEVARGHQWGSKGECGTFFSR